MWEAVMIIFNKMKNKIGRMQVFILEFIVAWIIGILLAYFTKSAYSTNSQYIDTFVYLDLEEVDTFQLLLFVMQSRIKEYLLIWLFSITILAVPYSTFFILYKGFTIGFVVGAMAVLHGFRGAFYAISLGLPHFLVYSIVMFQTIMISYKMHDQYNSGICNKRYKILVKQLPAFMVLLSLIIIGCFLESFLNPLLIAWVKTTLKLV